MSWKQILRVWTDRTHCCGVCHRCHFIAHISKIPKGTKLTKMSCALPIHPKDLKHGCRGYVGSYVKEDHTIDVYDYDINVKRYYLILGERAKEEKEEEIEETKAYPEDFIDSYNVYADEDDELEDP